VRQQQQQQQQHGQVVDQQELMEWEQEEVVKKPEVFLPELIHMAAYGYKTLGMPHVCANSKDVTAAQIHAFRDQHYVTSKMAVSGAGISHSALHDLASTHFGSMPMASAPPPTEQAVYVGGSRLYPMDKSPDNNALGIGLTQVSMLIASSRPCARSLISVPVSSFQLVDFAPRSLFAFAF
jgi:predicted Zn-dependent peptidase